MDLTCFFLDERLLIFHSSHDNAELEEGGKLPFTSVPRCGEEAGTAGEERRPSDRFESLLPRGAALLVNTFALTKHGPFSCILPKHH